MTSKRKHKLSLTIDEEIYQAIAATSKSYNIAKSQLAQKAFKMISAMKRPRQLS